MALSNPYADLERRDIHPLSGDSTSTPRKTASGTSCKDLRAIQRSDQKLWAFQTCTLISSDATSTSPSGDSTSTTRKTASGTSCKDLRASNGLLKSYGPFKPVPLSRATRPPPHRVAIPHLLQGKRHLEPPVKI